MTKALGDAGGVLSLVDEKGRKFLVQAARITYVEIGPVRQPQGRVRADQLDPDVREGRGVFEDSAPFARRRTDYLVSACSGTWERPPQARATVVSTASSWGSAAQPRASTVR